jgi:hypothetical protein
MAVADSVLLCALSTNLVTAVTKRAGTVVKCIAGCHDKYCVVRFLPHTRTAIRATWRHTLLSRGFLGCAAAAAWAAAAAVPASATASSPAVSLTCRRQRVCKFDTADADA